ncbi:MAG: hypothetical protein IPN34_15855 [Planctomycetes bacterium]|nr:hypothetical protein [Planctomycetota bacterium]
MQRLYAQPLAPELVLDTPAHVPTEQLAALVREAAAAFLEMIAPQRQTIWLLHLITGPAAIELLLPDLDEASGALLVGYAQQAVVALFRAYGAPFTPRASLHAAPRAEPRTWEALLDRAVALESVHSLKLFEALLRTEEPGDPLYRAIAERWLRELRAEPRRAQPRAPASSVHCRQTRGAGRKPFFARNASKSN